MLVHPTGMLVVVDVRRGLPALGYHAAVELTRRQPPGHLDSPRIRPRDFRLEEGSIVFYECTTEHGPGNEEMPSIVSEKDREAPTLAQWLDDPRSQHFRHS